MNVYQAIAAVQGELAKVGIAKGRRNQQQGYNFRGIDEVYAALSPLLAKYQLCVIPRCLERTLVEGRTAKGNPLFTVTVRAEFDFVSAEDGSIHTAATYGEAMATADKATNKAMSAAYKYAAFMTFAIPTEGDNDADAVTHEVAATKITDEQREHLLHLASEVGADLEAFCRFYKINAVPELPASSFEHAKKALESKRTKKEPA